MARSTSSTSRKGTICLQMEVRRSWEMEDDTIRQMPKGGVSMLNQSDFWKPQSPRGNKLVGWHRNYIGKILRSKAVIGERGYPFHWPNAMMGYE